MPEISAIITTHNRAGLLPRAVDSVRRQSLPPVEIIVVDDGSSDGTREWLRQQQDITTISFDEPGGISAARNAAISAARGEWLAFLDDDDQWLPKKLELQVEAVRSNPGYRLCHGDEIWIRNGRRVNPMHKHRKQGGWIYPDCLPLCVISPSAVMIRKDLFVDVGVFDVSLPACEDYDLWLRICAHEPVLYIDEALITKYGGHPDQLSRKHWGMDRFRIQSLENIIADGRLTEANRQHTVEMLVTKLRIYTRGAQKRGKHDEAQQYGQRLAEYESLLRMMQAPEGVAC